MLEIEHRVTLADVFVVIRRRVNERVPVGVAGLREVMNLAELPVRHLFERIEVRIRRGHFDGAAPTSGTVEIVAVRIGNFGPIDVDGVVMKPFVQRSGVANPGAVLILREGAAVPETHPDALGLGRNNAEFHAALRVHLWKLLARLIGRRGFPVIGRWFVFGRKNLARQNRSEREKREFCFHVGYLSDR